MVVEEVEVADVLTELVEHAAKTSDKAIKYDNVNRRSDFLNITRARLLAKIGDRLASWQLTSKPRHAMKNSIYFYSIY